MIQRPRGTRDFGPSEMETRRYFESMMRSICLAHGFREVQTPTFEHTELFTTKSGPGIVDEIYAFKDKGDREICLRPELTAPVIRFFINDLTNYPRPLKLFYFGPCFRYERPQAGRFREFYQFGAEVIGSSTPEMDAEVIGLAASMLEATGLQDYRIRIGHIGILRSLLAEAGVAGDAALPILQKLDKKLYDEAAPLMKGAGMSDMDIEKVVRTTQIIWSDKRSEGLPGRGKGLPGGGVRHLTALWVPQPPGRSGRGPGVGLLHWRGVRGRRSQAGGGEADLRGRVLLPERAVRRGEGSFDRLWHRFRQDPHRSGKGRFPSDQDPVAGLRGPGGRFHPKQGLRDHRHVAQRGHICRHGPDATEHGQELQVRRRGGRGEGDNRGREGIGDWVR